jgi:hypothetical protein
MSNSPNLEAIASRPEIRAAAESPKNPDLYELARNALVDLDGNVPAAIEDVISAITGSENLLQIVIRQTVEKAVESVVGSVMRTDRAMIYQAHTRSPSAGRKAVAALAGGIARSIFDFPLAGGVKLRDATREQVEKQADLYAAFAKDQATKATWLREIANRMGHAAKVSDALKESDVEAILHRASGT